MSALFRMEDEVSSLQPWQIYSALYVVFYVISAYFDHFLISFVFCIAFGVISEIMTKYMNGEQISHPTKVVKYLYLSLSPFKITFRVIYFLVHSVSCNVHSSARWQ